MPKLADFRAARGLSVRRMHEHFGINAYDRERSALPMLGNVQEYLWALGLDLKLTVTGLDSGPVDLDCHDYPELRAKLHRQWRELSERDQTLSGRRSKPGVRARSDTSKKAHAELSDRDLTALVLGVIGQRVGPIATKAILGQLKLGGTGLSKRVGAALESLVAAGSIFRTTKTAPHSYKLRQRARRKG